MSTSRSVDLRDCRTRVEIDIRLRRFLDAYIDDYIRERATALLVGMDDDDDLDAV